MRNEWPDARGESSKEWYRCSLNEESWTLETAHDGGGSGWIGRLSDTLA